jgi:YidC/Oxa1 family membrane protein insertase
MIRFREDGSKEEKKLQVTVLANILSPIAYVLGLIMNGIYAFFSLFGIENLALSIIIFTAIMKVLMLPLTIKQQKFTRLSSRMNPEIQKIQAKYKGKRDEASMRKQQAETQAVYQKYGTSPTSGCLPMLIMLPIMFALYQVVNNIPAYVTIVREQYQTVANAITGNQLVDQVAVIANFDVTKLVDDKSIISLLSNFKTSQWKELASLVPSADSAISYIRNVNGFFGLSVTDIPSWKSASIIIPILAMVLQFVQSKQLSVKTDKSNPTANAMSSMNYIFPIMSGFFALMLPIGVGIYWIANSAFSIIQQFFVNRYMDKVGMDELIEKSSAKAGKKYAPKSAPAGSSIQELARKQTRTIDTNVSERAKAPDKENSSEEDNSSSDKAGETYKPTSISEIANLLKNRNEKGDK